MRKIGPAGSVGFFLATAGALASAASGPAELAAQGAQSTSGLQLGPPTVEETTLPLGDGSEVRYAIALPDGYDRAEAEPRALVLALHPGGRSAYYGSWFLQTIVEPALRSWGAVMIAPDVPDRSWATTRSEQAVLALIEHVRSEHSVDPARVLVTGFSMGGRGTWHMAAHRPEVFTGGGRAPAVSH